MGAWRIISREIEQKKSRDKDENHFMKQFVVYLEPKKYRRYEFTYYFCFLIDNNDILLSLPSTNGLYRYWVIFDKKRFNLKKKNWQ